MLRVAAWIMGLFLLYVGISINRGTHNWWFIIENPDLKWMICGYPSFRKPPMYHVDFLIFPSSERAMYVMTGQMCRDRNAELL